MLTARGAAALACSTRGKKQSEVHGAGNAIAVACREPERSCRTCLGAVGRRAGCKMH